MYHQLTSQQRQAATWHGAHSSVILKKVKDSSLVGALYWHKEGRKAFARYREIDGDMKKELVSLLD